MSFVFTLKSELKSMLPLPSSRVNQHSNDNRCQPLNVPSLGLNVLHVLI